MNDNNVYKYALLLSRDKYVDLETFEEMVKTKRSFRLFKWVPSGLTYSEFYSDDGKNVRARNKTIGCWNAFLFYDGRKWHNISKNKKRWKHHNENKIMLPAHRFFKDEEEFKEWLTPALYNKLFIDLL